MEISYHVFDTKKHGQTGENSSVICLAFILSQNIVHFFFYFCLVNKWGLSKLETAYYKMVKGIIGLRRIFSYLEIKEDNPLHLQCLTANVLHHNSLKLLTLWRVVLGFSVSVIFLFWFRTEKRRFFRFGVCCGLRLLLYFAPGFQFSAKTESGFWICYSMQFGVFPVSLRKLCAGFDQNSLRSCGLLFSIAIGTVVAIY